MDFLQVVLTTVISAAVLFVIAKVSGHKQVAQLDFFDYISGITIGSIAAELATELEDPWKPLTALAVYGVIAVALRVLTSKRQKSRKYVNGTPTIILDRGKLYRENMKKAKLDLSEFMLMCRQAGYFDLNDIQTAVYEYDGKLSVLPVSAKRPATPADMNLAPPQETLLAEVIMDGRILHENLKRMGLDLNWLQKRLEEQGYKSADEVFLGICGEDHALTLFRGA